MALIDEWSGCLPLPSLADSKFHNYSTTANLAGSNDNFSSPEKELLNHSQRTMPQLPKQETIVTGKAERQIADIAIRFKTIQRIFLQHSTKQSSAHESRLDLKRMDFDWNQLSSDLANKMSIAQDLKELVERLEENPTEQVQEMVESKFQEYYLERHYGGLACDIHDLNIEQRQSSKCQQTNSIQSSHPLSSLSKCGQSEQSLQYINLNLRPQSKAVLSNLGCVSLVNQSNYSQGNYHSVTIQVPRIIEIQIPIIVYKLKERKVGLEESQLGGLGGDLDEIIDRFSRPYEQMYYGWKDQEKNDSGLILQTKTQKDMTEVELSYSQLPGEQLPLDSYAQIGSLISNPEVSMVHPHQLPTSTIIITEKLNSKSVLQKFQQIERALIDQNAELKQTITHLQQSLCKCQQKIIDIQKKSQKLSNRLQQQILYGQCLQRQIQKLNLQSYEQKIKNLSILQSQTSKKNQTLIRQLDAKILQLQMTKNELQQLRIVGQKTEQLLQQREQELTLLSKQLEEQQQQIYRLDNCEYDMKQLVSTSQINLKNEIQRLQNEKGQLVQQLNELKKRIEQDGLSLGYEEAKEIQGIIEERQHLFKIQLKQVQEKYTQIVNGYKNELQSLEKLKGQLQNRIQKQIQERVKEKNRFNTYVEDFKELIEEYHRQLQIKDNQILEMKQQKLHFENKFGQFNDQQNLTETLYQTIELLKEELQKQHQQRQKILQSMKSIQNTMSLSHNNTILHELQLATSIVQQLSHKLQSQITQNKSLQQQLASHTMSSSDKQKLQKQTLTLRKVNGKLKRYTKQLQNQLVAISGMSRCESHSAIIKLVCEERDYYRDLPTI